MTLKLSASCGYLVGLFPGQDGVEHRVLGFLERGISVRDGGLRVVLPVLRVMLRALDVVLLLPVADVLADLVDVLVPANSQAVGSPTMPSLCLCTDALVGGRCERPPFPLKA